MDQIRDVVTLDMLDDGALPAGEALAGETSAGETLAGETPAGETLAGETPAGETPAGETPTGETLAGETPAGETPTGETPTGETPTGETPTGEPPTGEPPAATGAAHGTGHCPVADGLAARRLQSLGSGARFAGELHGLLMRTPLFAGLGHTESRLLGAVMHVYAAHAGQTLITEGDTGDYMMLVMDGQVDVVRRDEHNFPVRIAVARPGQTLGEMSMVDGQRRFASCVAQSECRVAVLTRAALLALLTREPVLGNKVLLKLVSLLSDRLRETSAHLVNCLGKG